jgi:MYXO-CTERM domain-containing protein
LLTRRAFLGLSVSTLRSLLRFGFGLTLCLTPLSARADISWPAEQLLPSFSAPAPRQELIYIRGGASNWQAEGPDLRHSTGRVDGDGWLCQVGVDQPGYMAFGPYETGLPTGDNTARFRLKIDNNTTDDNVQVTLDVRDNTTGAVLASQSVTRKAFTVAGDWVTFSLPFTLAALGHQIETRVQWAGGAYVKLDSVVIDRGSEEELPLFASLKGVVNAKQPRIFSYEGDQFAEGAFTWLESLGLTWNERTDKWPLIAQFKSELAGVVIYDPLVPDTLNLATTIAGQSKALVASPRLAEKLQAAPYNLTVVQDLRGKFANKLAVYQSLLDNQWAKAPHRVVLGVSPIAHKAAVREYAVALGAAAIWLDPQVPAESTLLNKFLDAMDPGSAFMGWWPEEGAGVQRASEHGIATVASDYATNLTMHGGFPRDFVPKVIPPKPRLENKRYVAFILSDGDNLQFVEHLMRKLWNDPGRGQVPIGWTVSPAMLDAMPGALSYYASSATALDVLISGPSGWGYSYPNMYPNQESLDAFVARSDDYARRAGLRVVTIWNTITGGIDMDVGQSFAQKAPSVLGLTGQNTGGGLTVYSDKLPGFALSCNYCTGEQAMKDHIAKAGENWNGNEPRFILIQSQPWQNVTPSSFRNVKDSLDDTHVVVRPDHWFQLMRQAQKLPIEPISPIGVGVYRLINDASGKCVTATAASVGASVEQRPCENVDAQRWRYTPTDAGYGRLASVLDESLELELGGNEDGALTRLGATTQWQPIWETADRYHLLARQSDRCLDVPSGKADDVQLQQWSCNGESAQSFRFGNPVLEPAVGGSGGAAGANSGGSAVGGTSGGGQPTNGGQAPSGGQSLAAGSPTTPSTSDGGCGCRTAPRSGEAAASFAALALLAGFARRRRYARGAT